MRGGVTSELPASPALLSPLSSLLRCLRCGSELTVVGLAPAPAYPDLGQDGWLGCSSCCERYPVIGGTARMVQGIVRDRLAADYPEAVASLGLADCPDALIRGGTRDSRDSHLDGEVKQRTADSFAYEWAQFGTVRSEWAKNFRDYIQPHQPEWLEGRLVVDVGTGSGRHSAQAAALGARVVAVDLGKAVDVARRNLPFDVLTVQADAEALPFAHGTFDLVMSIGVLHHLRDTEAALRAITSLAVDGGTIHVYVYWVPERRWHRQILGGVAAVRRVTVRIPHALLHRLCIPLAAMLWAGVVVPYGTLRARPRTRRLANGLPLKTYADYPFDVLVNDQFDRFSAPIEQRFTRSQVQGMLERVGLRDIVVLPSHGWVGDGRVSRRPSKPAGDWKGVITFGREPDDVQLLEALESRGQQPDETTNIASASNRAPAGPRIT